MKETPTYRLLLVDDHQMFLDGLELLLQLHDDIEIVGTALNYDSALAKAMEHRPQIVITDLNMPGRDGAMLIAQLKSEMSGVKCIALTMLDDYASVNNAIQMGCDGYLLKNSGGTELYQAIIAVSEGGKYLTPQINMLLSRRAGTPDLNDILTAREKDVLKLVVEGMSSVQMADKLHVSVDTIKFHRKNLLSKLNQPNSAALVKFAMDNHLVDT
ncbi:MAG: response regulator transcription factor [Flavobacteriales bacterium]|nr:response regulator transcription factor [Flavobacteriales bacterium]